MSWPQWPSGNPVMPSLTSITPVVNAAPAVLPPGAQYSPEQWAQMQQQNWQQWAQWQQQYQQWHQQYGAEYQKSMSALNQTSTQPPIPNTFSSVPPPLPVESKPPLPPEEPVETNIQPPPEVTKPFTPQQHPNFSAPPPSFQHGPPPNQYKNPPPSFPNQPKPFQNKPEQSNYGNNKPDQQNFGSNQRGGNQTRNYNSFNSQNRNNRPDSQKPPPSLMSLNLLKPLPVQNEAPMHSEPKRMKMNEPSAAESVPPNATGNNEVLSETEKKFIKQFTEWEAQFNNWKEQNMNHPDKDQYREYEKKWEAWRAQLLERREQMRRKRLGIPENPKAGPVGVPSPVGAPATGVPAPNLNKAKSDIVISNRPPSAQSQSLPVIEVQPEVPDDGTTFIQMKASEGIPGLDLVKDGDEEETPKETSVIDLIKSPENQNKASPDFDAISKGINNILGDAKLLSMLSMVSQNQQAQSSASVTDSTSKIVSETTVHNSDAKDHFNEGSQGAWSNQGDRQNFDAGSNYDQSRGSFNTRGDQDWQNQDRYDNQGDYNYRDDYNDGYGSQNKNFRGPKDFPDNSKRPDNFQGRGPNNFSEDNFEQSGNFRDRDNFGPGSFEDDNYQDDDFQDNNFRGPGNFRGRGNFHNNEQGGFRGRGNFRGRGFFRGRGGFHGTNSFQDNYQDDFEEPHHFKDDFENEEPDNFKGDENWEDDNFQDEPVEERDNFGNDNDGRFRRNDNLGGPGSFQGDRFDNFRGSQNFGRNAPPGPDKFGRNAPQAPDNFGRNLPQGPDNFGRNPPQGSDKFGKNPPQGPDNFSKNPPQGPDNFGRNAPSGPDNLGRKPLLGPDNFGRNAPPGPDNFGRNPPLGPDKFGRNAPSGPDNFGRNPPQGPDNFGRNGPPGPDNFGRNPSQGPDNFGRNAPPGPDKFGRNPPQGPDKFGRNGPPGPDNFGRNPQGPDNFGRNALPGPDNFGQKPPQGPDSYGRNGPDNFGRNPPHGPNNFGRNAFQAPDGFGRNAPQGPDNFGRNALQGPNDTFRGQNIPDVPPNKIGGERGNYFHEENRPNFEPSPFGGEDGDGRFRQQSFDSGPPGRFGDNDQGRGPIGPDHPPPLGDGQFIPVDAEIPKCEPVVEEPLWQPTTVIEYEHKSIKSVEWHVSLEPLRNFNYRHKPVSRIPQPERPEWLKKTLRNCPEFDFIITRSFEPPPFNRYAYDNKRYDRHQPEPNRYQNNNRFEDNRRNNWERDDRHDDHSRQNRYDDYDSSYNRRPRNDDNFQKQKPRFEPPSQGPSSPKQNRRFEPPLQGPSSSKQKLRFEPPPQEGSSPKLNQRFEPPPQAGSSPNKFDEPPSKIFCDRPPMKRDSPYERDRDVQFNRKDEPFGRDQNRNRESGHNRESSFGRENNFNRDPNSRESGSNRDPGFSRDLSFGREPNFNRQDSGFNRETSHNRDVNPNMTSGNRNMEPNFNRQDSGFNRDTTNNRDMTPNIPSGNRNVDMKADERIFRDEELKLSNPKTKSVTLIEDILNPPGRFSRPHRIVIILRGPPGSGKTYLAKLIKDKEVENGGSAPRILSLDDYFMVEQEKSIDEDGKRTKVKEMVYEYDDSMEIVYRNSLLKAFKKTVTDGFFPFIIVDNINEKVKYFGEMWSFAKQNGFQVYVCQVEFDLPTCTKRNIHNRSESEIQKIINGWEQTPNHHPVLDATSLVQSASIPEVEMEEINSPPTDECEETAEDLASCSKWDNFDCSIGNLAKLDGTSKPLRASKTMEDYLQIDGEWVSRESNKPGQKRVRWADLEERKEQEKMRAIGFVVGQTNWNRMMDPTMGSGALTQTKYIERVGRFRRN